MCIHTYCSCVKRRAYGLSTVGKRTVTVIDYLLSTPVLFIFIRTFVVCDFNEFSDHAPLLVELDVNTLRACAPIDREVTGDIYNCKRSEVYRCNSEYLYLCKETSRVNIDSLCSYLNLSYIR